MAQLASFLLLNFLCRCTAMPSILPEAEPPLRHVHQAQRFYNGSVAGFLLCLHAAKDTLKLVDLW